jgi:uncharacterized protein (TIGR02217 family)
MSFDEVRFPEDIAYGSGGGPEYSTDIVVTQGGFEQRNSNWSASRARFNVAHGVKDAAQLETLIAFFRARKGRARGFRFKDWTDYRATNQLLGIGNGSQTAFPLVKSYNSGTVQEQRRIFKPVAGTVTVYVNGVAQAGVSVNLQWGRITLASPPASGAEIRADFEFDLPVRFDTDRLSARLEGYGHHSWLEIPLVELRLAEPAL